VNVCSHLSCVVVYLQCFDIVACVTVKAFPSLWWGEGWGELTRNTDITIRGPNANPWYDNRF